MVSKKESEELISWIESQPELDYLRKKANKSLCEYRQDQTSPSQRIRINPRDELEQEDENLFKSFIETIWVPSGKFRGTSYSSKELDRSLSSVSKVMSISTIWDFFSTLPIFYFAVSTLAKSVALPFSFVLGYLILWGSNISGQNSTNRSKGNNSKATASLVAFLILSLIKTLVSGVGIDMIMSKEAIMEDYASEVVEKKDAEKKQEMSQKKKRLEDQLSRLDKQKLVINRKVDNPELKLATQECNSLKEQMSGLNTSKRKERQIYEELRLTAYGVSNQSYINLPAQEILDKYGATLPPCRKVNVLASIEGQKNLAKTKTSNIKDDAYSDDFKSYNEAERKWNLQLEDKMNMSNLRYLNEYYIGDYLKDFRGQPPGLKWVVVDKASQQKLGDMEATQGPLKWASGGKAVEQATVQFFRKLQDPNKIASLGLSLFGFTISIVLTASAAALLYASSKSQALKASFDSRLNKKSNQLLSSYREVFIASEKDVNLDSNLEENTDIPK